MVIPLFANQDLTPMLSQHYWQESFDGDSSISQSRFDAYARKSSLYKVRFCYSLETMLDDTQDRKSQTKERTVYDREFLLQCRSSPLANEMPLELKIIDGDEGSAFCSFINPEVSMLLGVYFQLQGVYFSVHWEISSVFFVNQSLSGAKPQPQEGTSNSMKWLFFSI